MSTARRVDAGAFEFLRECFEECHMGRKPEHRLEGIATAESLVIATCVLPFAYTREQDVEYSSSSSPHITEHQGPGSAYSASRLLKKRSEPQCGASFLLGLVCTRLGPVRAARPRSSRTGGPIIMIGAHWTPMPVSATRRLPGAPASISGLGHGPQAAASPHVQHGEGPATALRSVLASCLPPRARQAPSRARKGPGAYHRQSQRPFRSGPGAYAGGPRAFVRPPGPHTAGPA